MIPRSEDGDMTAQNLPFSKPVWLKVYMFYYFVHTHDNLQKYAEQTFKKEMKVLKEFHKLVANKSYLPHIV